MTVRTATLYLIITYCWYCASNVAFSITEWTQYATSKYYIDTRMLTGLEDFFDPIYFSKDYSLLWARIQCSSLCSSNFSCEAFTFYETDTNFVCEPQPDHFCGSKTTKALISLTSSSVWFKQTPTTNLTCFNSMLSGLECSLARYGCLGTYPDCYNCPKTCIDCYNRSLITLFNTCVLWPDGDTNFTARPIFVYCNKTRTVLIQRTVDFNAGFLLTYKMSFTNVNRLYRLKAHNLLIFIFDDGLISTSAIYGNCSIEANGTLSNITMTKMLVPRTKPAGDIFQLNGKHLQPVPFVVVLSDLYYCGSFWLLDPTNATYCPGGKLSLFGSPKSTIYIKGSSLTIDILSTGIRYPGASSNNFITFVSVELA